MKATRIVIPIIAMVFMPGIGVQAEDITYDFDDATLQGWNNFEGVTEEFVAWNQADGRANIEPARSGEYLVKEANFGDRDADTSVKILTSPAFWIGASTSVEIWTLGGTGATATPTWTNYSNLPAVAGNDFMGAALRRVSDGEYLLFSRRGSVGESGGSYEAIGWDAPSIAAAVAGDSASQQYVVDIIDTFSGVWGWITCDDITLTDIEIVGNVIARRPSPANLATDVSRDVVPSWTAGLLSDKHDVYFGTNLDNVANASRTNPLDALFSEGQDATEHDFGRLEFGQTYFWRIDEVNDAATSTVFTGEVWSFTIEPLSRPITNIIVAAASGSFGDSFPEKTIDGSGLVDDLHGTRAGDMWISGGIPATIEYAFDRVYKLHELWIWNSNQVIEVFVGFGAKDVVIEHSLDGENWTALDGVGPLARAPGRDDYAHDTPIDFGGVTARHVRVTINSVQGIAPQASLSEVRFLYTPTFAAGPNPALGATNVAPDTTLSWSRNGREAGRHEIYVGTHANDLALAGAVSESSFSTDDLDLQLGQTYSWRVDEVNEAMDPSTWTGDVWSFTTVETLTVDDMESYRDAEFLEIWATWVDGFDDPANGSLVGGAAGTPETSIVHAGGQSLPMDYDNSSASVSETTRTFDTPMDWSGHGVQSLLLYLNRGMDNTGGGQVYVKINDTKVMYEGGADLPPGWDAWTQWTIDLSAVADAARVRSLTIGVEGAGAMGVLYVDSIQLVKNAPPAPPQPISWFEAESAAMTAPLLVFSDSPSASAGQHIGTLDGLGDENDNPPADGVATYSFTVPEDGVYQLAIRVIITGGSNSFWLRIPGMATNTTNHASGWVRFNDISDGAAWHWNEVRSSDDGDSVVRFTLSAGTHTLEIARREDGTLLDAIALTQLSTALQPTVSTEKASYSPNEPIIVNFTNAGGNSTDWVGFFLDGDASENYIDFIYLNGAIDGSVTYDAGLSTPGTYNVRLLFNDSYTVEAGNTFTIE